LQTIVNRFFVFSLENNKVQDLLRFLISCISLHHRQWMACSTSHCFSWLGVAPLVTWELLLADSGVWGSW